MKNLFKYFAFLIFLYILWYFGFGYFSFLLFFMILAVISLCLLFSVIPMKKTTVSLKLHNDHCLRGEKITMTFSRQSRSLIQCGQIMIEYQIIDAFSKNVMKNKVYIHDQNIDHVISCPHCGHYILKIQQIRCYDLLQCFSFSKTLSIEAAYDVLPQYHRVHLSVREISQKAQESDHYSTTQNGDDYSEIFEIRNYHEGDQLKHIHWNMSSKYQQLFVKAGSQPVEHKLVLAMEYKENNTFYDLQFDYFYSLALSLLKENITFAVITSFHHRQPDMQTVSSPENLMTVMRWLMKYPITSLNPAFIQQSFCLIKGEELEVHHS